MRSLRGQARQLIEPATPLHTKTRALAVVAMLGGSAICSFGAAALMPESYSWTSNVISESAAQGVEGAWFARLGFVLFGLAVLCLASAARAEWAKGAYWCHIAFGVFMVGTAAFSHRPWLPDTSFDAFEDFLHSVTATGMGFAFSFALVFGIIRRARNVESGKGFDVVAIAAAVVLPVIGGETPANAGWTQRLLFAIAYAWYLRETIGLMRSNAR